MVRQLLARAQAQTCRKVHNEAQAALGLAAIAAKELRGEASSMMVFDT
jgi:hypothetical protein